MAEAGADIVVAHMGLTTGGVDRRATTAKSLDDCVGADRRRWPRPPARCATTCWCSATAARSPRRTTPRTCWSNTEHCHGFYGASSMERLPTETALIEQTRAFKSRLARPDPH